MCMQGMSFPEGWAYTVEASALDADQGLDSVKVAHKVTE